MSNKGTMTTIPFLKMNERQKIEFLILGQDASQIAPRQYKEGFDQLKLDAASATIRWLAEERDKTKALNNVKKVKPVETYAEKMQRLEDEYGSDLSLGDVSLPDEMVITHTEQGESPYWYSVVNFINALPKCIPLYLGFHISLGTTDWCYCPCGRQMKIWRQVCNVNEVIGDDGSCRLAGNKRESRTLPEGLIKHIDALKYDTGGPDHEIMVEVGHNLHGIVYKYLEILYSDYWEKGISHKAFYDHNTKDWKKASTAENRVRQKAIDMLTEQFKNLELREEQRRVEEKKLLGENERLNNELQRTKRAEGKLQDLLKVTVYDVSADTFSDDEVAKYQGTLNYYIKMVTALYAAIKTDMKRKKRNNNNKQDMENIEFCVNNNLEAVFGGESAIDIPAELMKLMGSNQSTVIGNLLFGKIDEADAWLAFLGWNVTFKDTSVKKKELKYHIESKGKGATHQFIYDFWSQLYKLDIYNLTKTETRISKNSPLRKLFVEFNDNFWLFQNNEIIEGWKVASQTRTLHKKKIKQTLYNASIDVYQAFGRIMLYCLLNSADIPESILPVIYQNYLIRGVSPLQDEYKICDLIQHFMSMHSQLSVKGAEIINHVLRLPRGRDVMSQLANNGLYRLMFPDVFDHLNESFIINPKEMLQAKKYIQKTVGLLRDFDFNNTLLLAGAIKEYLQLLSNRDNDDKIDAFNDIKSFRQVMHTLYIEDYSIALKAIKEGLTLNGHLRWDMAFALIPLNYVSKNIFYTAKISAELICQALRLADDTIDTYDIIKGGYNHALSSSIENQKEILQFDDNGNASGFLPNLIRKNKDNDGFLADFLFWVTSSSTIRPNSDLVVEFSCDIDDGMANSNAFPMAHSCLRLLKVPAHGYDGNEEMFVSKLQYAITHTGKTMQMS